MIITNYLIARLFFFEQTTYLDYWPAQYKGEEEPLQSAGFTRESSMEF